MKDKIIEDYKNTISRFQQECTEKTNLIIKLISKNNFLKEELNQVQLLLNNIEKICKHGVYDEFNMPLDECDVILYIIDKAKGEG